MAQSASRTESSVGMRRILSPPLAEWDDRIQSLCQLIHGHCTPEKLDVLARDEYFWEQLHSLEKSDSERKMVIHGVWPCLWVAEDGKVTDWLWAWGPGGFS